jgi:hypothetical protein
MHVVERQRRGMTMRDVACQAAAPQSVAPPIFPKQPGSDEINRCYLPSEFRRLVAGERRSARTTWSTHQ